MNAISVFEYLCNHTKAAQDADASRLEEIQSPLGLDQSSMSHNHGALVSDCYFVFSKRVARTLTVPICVPTLAATGA